MTIFQKQASIRKQDNLVEIEAHEKFNRRHMGEIFRVLIFPPNNEIGENSHARIATNYGAKRRQRWRS